MLVHANLGNVCRNYRFEGQVSAWQIVYSVGIGGRNQNEDVLTIQQLLNLIPPTDGGPVVPLDEDGWIGPKTNGAILAFQKFQKTGSDGRVDPHGPTLKRMNELQKPKLGQRNAARMARAVSSMPDLKGMAQKGLRTIERARDYVMLGAGALGNTKRDYELADLHFKFDNQARQATLSDLSSIQTTFRRVKTVLQRRPSPVTGGDAFGISIFTIDPLGKPYSAYSPKQSNDDRRDIPEVHSGRVYLAQGLDKKVPDHFTHILLHELFHFVDEESKEHSINDHGYRDGAMRLPHEKRMHNADNYALFASHVHYGRTRLVASQPALGPYIPQNM